MDSKPQFNYQRVSDPGSMDARYHLCESTSFCLLVWSFLLLFSGLDDLASPCLDDLASRSPASWKTMAAILKKDAWQVRGMIYGIFATILSVAIIRDKSSTEPYPPKTGKIISKAFGQQYRTHIAFYICAWIHVWARLIAGRNCLLVGSLSSASIAFVIRFMAVASSMDSSILARWVMAQSTMVAVILVFQGYFLRVSFIPFLPAIFYAMHNSLAPVSSFEGEEETRSKTGGQNQNVAANSTQMAIKVANTVETSAIVAENQNVANTTQMAIKIADTVDVAEKRLDTLEDKWVVDIN